MRVDKDICGRAVGADESLEPVIYEVPHVGINRIDRYGFYGRVLRRGHQRDVASHIDSVQTNPPIYQVLA